MVLVTALVFGPAPAHASPSAVAIEIDARAEALIDPHVLRRRVQLELADVEVPPPLGQSESALFVRVLAADDGDLRVELWERGVAHGARVVGEAKESGPLLARRVALAAAELARELSDTRQDEAEQRAHAQAQKLAAERARRERTREGPRALRVGVAGLWSRNLALLGPALAAELHVYKKARLDVDASAGFGAVLRGGGPAESLTLGFGPARRMVLGSRWDLDWALRGAASLLEFSDARGVDGIPAEHQSWTASLEGRLRLEPRLSRGVRLALGVGAGMLLRRVPLVLENGASKGIDGPFVSGELALILTPF